MRNVLGSLRTLIHENSLNNGSNRVRLGLATNHSLIALASDGCLRPLLKTLLQNTDGLANQLTRTIDTPRLHEEIKPVRIILCVHVVGTLNVEVLELTSLESLLGFRNILDLLFQHLTGTLLINVEPLGNRTHLRLTRRLRTQACCEMN